MMEVSGVFTMPRCCRSDQGLAGRRDGPEPIHLAMFAIVPDSLVGDEGGRSESLFTGNRMAPLSSFLAEVTTESA